MHLFKKNSELQQYLKAKQEQGLSIGFVPTMGALHQGHLSLIHNAQEKADIIVCSIFVNPTQFDDKSDLAKYPRPVSKDMEKLEAIGCHVLFLPSAEEIYPPDLPEVHFDLAGLDKTMEGAHRTGHFEGVVQVVHRLLDIVQPDSLYMGQKDFQQFTIIKRMLKLMDSPIQLVRVPIMREEDGLAMSSRNVRLSETGRKKAGKINKILFQAQEDAKKMDLATVRANALTRLKEGEFDVDYFTIVDGDSLQEINRFEQSKTSVVCTTIRIDGIRLLDNIILKEA
ncbi:MAG: pantoate--beta-alanine ligase [Aureispira sp.]|nr:pantoate--beta-alanine ligase [Aureispira sp.]